MAMTSQVEEVPGQRRARQRRTRLVFGRTVFPSRCEPCTNVTYVGYVHETRFFMRERNTYDTAAVGHDERVPQVPMGRHYCCVMPSHSVNIAIDMSNLTCLNYSA